jgi:molybdenum cofactor biosynthesis enzyme MoaA
MLFLKKQMFSNHMNDEVASISFNLNKIVQNNANIECNYCHKKGHFANGRAQN